MPFYRWHGHKKRRRWDKRFIINSQAVLNAICSARTRNSLVQKCADALDLFATTKEVNLGVPSNEKADKLGTEDLCVGPETFLGILRQMLEELE